MYLKSLELHGFKSFPNRTVLTFERGATVIVGPNGSGKSNISDAMRWVLGELSSRNIRGTKMEDVIFGGTDERRPMGFAEVSVTFDNSDPDNRLDSPYDEVTVTRRYYRTGESEYLINKEPKRLKDIHMLFMNTGVGREGYSIIGQGKIQEIISKKSDDRRSIFEEAAGISRFRYRKEEAERKLKGVSENLDRVNDIRLMLESRVGPLEKDAEKARRGLAIYEDKKRCDVSLWLFDSKKIIEDIEAAERQWTLEKNELEIVEQSIRDLEAQYETLYLRYQSGKLKSGELIEEIQRTTERLHALDNTMTLAESEFKHSAMLIEDCRARISELEASIASQDETKDGYFDKIKDVKKLLKEQSDVRLSFVEEQQRLTREINELQKLLDGALQDLIVEENNETDLKIRIDVLKNASTSDGIKSKDIEKEIEKYEAEGKRLEAEALVCEDNVSGFKKDIAEKDEIIAKSESDIESLTEEKAQISESLASVKLDRDSALQKADLLQRMNEHFDGYIESVKFVMREYSKGNISGKGEIYGPLSTLISVEKEYITAIDTALAASLQNIVVENEETAKAAIYALKKAGAGRATFYPISSVKAATETDEIRRAKTMPGFVGRADTLVKVDDKYRSIVEMLLLRTLVFDNIDNASDAAKRIGYKVKLVTLDGQVISANGSFTGGSAKRDSGILSRVSEIAALKEKADKLTQQMNKLSSALSEIDEELNAAENASLLAKNDKELLLTLSRTQFADLDRANAKLEANNDMLARFRQDYENLIANQDRIEEELITLTAALKASNERTESLKQFRKDKGERMGMLDEMRDEVIGKANDAYIKVIEYTKEIESIEALVASVDSRIGELNAQKAVQEERIASLTEKRSSSDAIKAERVREYEELEKRLSELNAERREVDSDNDEFDREINTIRQTTKEKGSHQQTLLAATMRSENAVNSLKEKQDKLGSSLWDEYEITYEDAVSLGYPEVTSENRDEIAAMQASCKSKLRSLGSFNPGAIEEYAQVKTEYDYLNTQYTDLTKSQEELVGIIDSIMNEMKTSFIDAFNAINKNFSITFKELFGGGNAELSLTEPEDVLSSGIEIKAAPPGKIIKSMSLLSGGEQSFVAIALLFAILKVNPTPFCILDEIEAALDEVNVYRFGDYVTKFSMDTQFILITHRRGTMEIGDRLYGVTMPQRGISQAIELNVNEIEGKQKELLDGVL